MLVSQAARDAWGWRGLEVEEGGDFVERKGVSQLNDLCMLNKVWIHDAR